jgi:hypothetical protein
MTSLALLLALSAPAADAPKPAPAKVTITAEAVCAHCSFGIESEGGCCACLKLDDKTPVILKGKAAEPLFKVRFDKKVFVAEGTLSVNKDKLLVLELTGAHERTDADKGKAPESGQVKITGTVLAKDGKLSIQNADAPLSLDVGKNPMPKEDAVVDAVGKLVNTEGKARLDATTVQPAEKK